MILNGTISIQFMRIFYNREGLKSTEKVYQICFMEYSAYAITDTNKMIPLTIRSTSNMLLFLIEVCGKSEVNVHVAELNDIQPKTTSRHFSCVVPRLMLFGVAIPSNL